MNPLLLAPLIEFGGKLLDRFIPDTAERAKAELELLKLTQESDFKLVIAQLDINAKEAAHPSIFVAGWRPAVGWTCGFGLAYQTVFHNILEWISVVRGWPGPPAIDSEVLIYTLGGLLGIAGLRSLEKVKKVSK